MLDRLLEWLTAPLSRSMRVVVLPVLGVLLTLIFVFLGFPYEVLADRAVNALEQQSGAVIRYGEVEPRLTVGGPGFRFHDVDVRLRQGGRYRAEKLSVRPAWSLGWLTGSPRLRTFLLSDHGSLAGFVTVGRSFDWDGRVVDLDLGVLPLAGVADGVELTGRADLDADVLYEEGVATGEIALKARQGDVVHPVVPMPIEFDTVEGRVVLGGDALARIDAFDLEGPLFAASATGTVGHAPRPGQEPLDLTIGIDVREPGMIQMARQFGLALDRGGHADIVVTGTLANPELRE